jgi:hypothetical protein
MLERARRAYGRSASAEQEVLLRRRIAAELGIAGPVAESWIGAPRLLARAIAQAS